MTGQAAGVAIALGLVGVGKIARDQHLPAIAAEPSVRLVALASRDAHEQPDVRYASLTELLESEPEVTAISLASPPVGRAELAREALLAGKHVMLEKPPCATLGEARALLALAQERSLTLFASWHSREAAGVEGARAWLADKVIVSVSITWREDVRVWHPGQEWIFAAGGMGVFDPAINALSILTEILPGHVSVQAAQLEVPRNRESPMRARVDLLHDLIAPIAGDFDFLYEGDPEWTIEIVTEQGLLRLERGGAALSIGAMPLEIGDNHEYPRLYRRFAELASSGTSDADLRPLELVADAMLVGERQTIGSFNF